MSTFSRIAWLAFRIRVSISAIGSVIDMRDSTDAWRASDLHSARDQLAGAGFPQPAYQEALMTPGISPRRARLRKQMRHI